MRVRLEIHNARHMVCKHLQGPVWAKGDYCVEEAGNCGRNFLPQFLSHSLHEFIRIALLSAHQFLSLNYHCFGPSLRCLHSFLFNVRKIRAYINKTVTRLLRFKCEWMTSVEEQITANIKPTRRRSSRKAKIRLHVESLHIEFRQTVLIWFWYILLWLTLMVIINVGFAFLLYCCTHGAFAEWRKPRPDQTSQPMPPAFYKTADSTASHHHHHPPLLYLFALSPCPSFNK